MDDLEFYAQQTRESDPGEFGARLAEVPGTLAAMRAAASQLVFHYRGGGDYAENGVEPGRISEIDTRYARDMLARIFALSDQPLTAPREPRLRTVGCCRDFTVLFLALARAHGVPARARVGFGAYFEPGWCLDHVVAEAWDESQQRWRLIDPELPDGYTDSAGRPADPGDLTREQFLTGAVAWRACRSGADASRFLVDPGLEIPVTRGWPYIRHNLILDLAALAGHEMVLWDFWGWGAIDDMTDSWNTAAGTGPHALSPGQLAVLDEVAEVCSGEPPVEAIQELYQRDGLRVPPVVTSFSLACAAPLQVRL
jgi:hypothetical protein